MRKKILDDKFYMPSQIDIGSAEKDVTEPTETPYPLAKGSDGLPKFNELQEAQKKNMPKAMRTQVAFQQQKLQYSNYQIVNSLIRPTDSVSSANYYQNTYNSGTAVGTALEDGIMFGTNTADDSRAKYYNIVYANIRFAKISATVASLIQSPSYIEFYPIQKIGAGGGGVDFGGKIPRQIEAVDNQTNVTAFSSTGADNGVQSFGIDIYNENAYYTRTPDLKGIRCCGVALKEIFLNFGEAVVWGEIYLHLEIGIDLTTEGNNY